MLAAVKVDENVHDNTVLSLLDNDDHRDDGPGRTEGLMDDNEANNEELGDESDDDSSSSSQSSTMSPTSALVVGKGMGTGSLSSSSLSSTASTSSTVSSSSTTSSLSSMSELQQNGRGARGGVRRRVSFGHTNIQECLHHQDMTCEERYAAWYTFEDFQRLKGDRRALVKLMDQFELKETKDGCVVVLPPTTIDSPETSEASSQHSPSSLSSSSSPARQLADIDDSIRGLEFRTKEGKRKRHYEIQTIVQAVLHEQQSRSSGMGLRSFSMPSLFSPDLESSQHTNADTDSNNNNDNDDDGNVSVPPPSSSGLSNNNNEVG